MLFGMISQTKIGAVIIECTSIAGHFDGHDNVPMGF
jgi:hypothetical protein